MNCSGCASLLIVLATASLTSSQSWFRFTQPVYNASIMERSPPRTYVTPDHPGMGIFVGRDTQSHGPTLSVTYSIQRGRIGRLFRPESKCVGDFCFLLLRTRSGTHSALNREKSDSYRVMVDATARVRGVPPLSDRAEVMVRVLDVNDLSPLFDAAEYHATVPENATLHQWVAKVTASDADVGVNGEVYYGLVDSSDTFAVHPTTGVVTLTRRLNAAHRSSFQLEVTARDRGPTQRLGSPRVSRASLHVTVVSENLHAPEMSVRRMPAVTEHGSVGTVYAIVTVRDRDSGRNGQIDAVTIVSGDPDRYFDVRPVGDEYTVEVVRTLDRERHADGFVLTLAAADRGRPALTASTEVRVTLQDVNDNAPVFRSSSFVVNASECVPVRTPLAYLAAADADDDDNARVTYSIAADGGRGLFDVGPSSGTLRVVGALDAEVDRSVEVTVVATDHANVASRKRQTAQLRVNIIDCNDNPPVFGYIPSVVELAENLPAGSVVFDVDAEDADSGDNGFVSYSFVSADSVPFSINPFTGLVTTKKTFDYESMQREYNLVVRASDWGSPFRRDVEAVLRVHIQDVNDNRPHFERTNCSGFVYRDAAQRTQLVLLSAVDFDAGDVVTYQIDSGNDDDCFEVDSQTGQLRTKSCFEGLYGSRLDTRVVVVAATDGYHQTKTAVTLSLLKNHRSRRLAGRGANIHCRESGVADELRRLVAQQASVTSTTDSPAADVEQNRFSRNVHSPQFPASTARRLSVREGSAVRKIATLSAVDEDHGYNGLLLYVISTGNDQDVFRIGTESGDLFTVRVLDRELQDEYRLNVTVVDMGNPQRSASILVHIDVEDVNDNSPVFERSSYTVTVPENAAVGSVLTTVTANDLDDGDNGRIVYRLSGEAGPFAVNSATGEIRLSSALDRELMALHEVVVIALDRSREAPLSGTSTVVVRVDDVNDNPPAFVPADYRVRLLEDLPVGTVVGTVLAVDPDAGNNGVVRYSIVDGDDGFFSMDRVTGVVRLSSELSFNTREVFNLTVRAKDRAGARSLSTSTTMVVEVVPVDHNLHPPLFRDFVFQGRVRENQPAQTSVMQLIATDQDVDNPTASPSDFQIVYSIRNGTGLGRFSIDSKGTSGVFRFIYTVFCDYQSTFICHTYLTHQNSFICPPLHPLKKCRESGVCVCVCVCVCVDRKLFAVCTT